MLPKQTSVFSIISDLIPGLSLDFSLEKDESCWLSEVPGAKQWKRQSPGLSQGVQQHLTRKNLTSVTISVMVRKIMFRENWGFSGKKMM